MRIRALTFDYGGTLDGEASHWLDRFAALYAEAGVVMPFERIKAAFYRADDESYACEAVRRMGLRELMDFHVGAQLRELGVADRELHEMLRERFVERSEAALASSRRVLEGLAGRFRLGVISNFYGNVERILQDAGFASLLSVVSDSSRLGAAKPDRRIFEHTVRELGVPAGEVLHVGDSYERDIVAARAAGLRTAWLAGATQPSGAAGGAEDLRLASLAELADRLR